MTSLQPYRPTGSFFGMPQARKRSPISNHFWCRDYQPLDWYILFLLRGG